MLDVAAAYKNFSKDIYTYIFLRVNKRHIADDLLQDTFYKAFKYKAKYNPSLSNTRTWLTSIAKNLVTDYYKERYKEIAQVDISESNGDFTDQLDLDLDSENKLMYEQIIKSLNLLPDKDRELIILRYINEFDLKEIAELLNLSYDSVKVASNRAVKRLRDLHET